MLFATQQGRGQSPWPGGPALGPATALAWGPAPKPAGEASLGPVYAKALQGTAGWRKEAPRPCRGLCSLGSLCPSWASGIRTQVNLRPRALGPLYTPGNPYQGLRDPVTGYLPPSTADDKAQARGSHPGSCHSPCLGPMAQPWPCNQTTSESLPWPSVRQGPPGYGKLEEGGTHPKPCRGLCSLGSLSPGWAFGMGAQTNLRPKVLRPLYIPGNPYQGLWNPSQAICHPAGQRAKPRQGVPNLGPATTLVWGPGSSWAPEPKSAGEASLGPMHTNVLQCTAGWRKGAPTPGSGTSVCSVGSQVWRRDPSDRAARWPYTLAPRACWPRPLRCPVPEPLDPKGVRSSLSLVIQR
ncbi:hypothetical protein NDU88_006054 [Pleurodeles waltl]|uniref:Uncharacterized protein n=1 Tax=Pleurodeles waltl TaxID=8319 RepID=A0AAV7QJR2_PLEWA|nr:hypothetical protein NDU88_006054 [Pleurodeles waltl]